MDWVYLAENPLWIVALAWLLALFGIVYWESMTQRQPFSKVFSQIDVRISLDLAILLFSLGLGLVTVPLWEKVLWFVLSLACLGLVIFSLRLKKRVG